ncbi:MAG: OmpA family protein [Deltaproteobacteria bacterium]|nr:OmpA family protein [Deltaproteobacteria bacterium]
MRTTLRTMMALCCGSLLLAACGPEYPACEEDEDCKEVHPDEWCVNNLCVKCRNDQDCLVGQECRDGNCRAIPGYCDPDHRCPAGQVCRDNRCSPCLSDDECGPGMMCQNGACVPMPQCDAAHPCPAGEECINGYCRPIPPPPECQFSSVYFDYDKYAVRRDQRDALAANRQCMTEHGRTLSLTGYCDERGSEEYNMALGQDRADAVRQYLINLGVQRSSIGGVNSRGKVEARHCYDEACWQNDRRVDFRD